MRNSSWRLNENKLNAFPSQHKILHLNENRESSLYFLPLPLDLNDSPCLKTAVYTKRQNDKNEWQQQYNEADLLHILVSSPAPNEAAKSFSSSPGAFGVETVENIFIKNIITKQYLNVNSF